MAQAIRAGVHPHFLECDGTPGRVGTLHLRGGRCSGELGFRSLGDGEGKRPSCEVVN